MSNNLYKYITNPKNNKKVNVDSDMGKSILRNYNFYNNDMRLFIERNIVGGYGQNIIENKVQTGGSGAGDGEEDDISFSRFDFDYRNPPYNKDGQIHQGHSQYPFMREYSTMWTGNGRIDREPIQSRGDAALKWASAIGELALRANLLLKKHNLEVARTEGSVDGPLGKKIYSSPNIYYNDGKDIVSLKDTGTLDGGEHTNPVIRKNSNPVTWTNLKEASEQCSDIYTLPIKNGYDENDTLKSIETLQKQLSEERSDIISGLLSVLGKRQKEARSDDRDGKTNISFDIDTLNEICDTFLKGSSIKEILPGEVVEEGSDDGADDDDVGGEEEEEDDDDGGDDDDEEEEEEDDDDDLDLYEKLKNYRSDEDSEAAIHGHIIRLQELQHLLSHGLDINTAIYMHKVSSNDEYVSYVYILGSFRFLYDDMFDFNTLSLEEIIFFNLADFQRTTPKVTDERIIVFKTIVPGHYTLVNFDTGNNTAYFFDSGGSIERSLVFDGEGEPVDQSQQSTRSGTGDLCSSFNYLKPPEENLKKYKYNALREEIEHIVNKRYYSELQASYVKKRKETDEDRECRRYEAHMEEKIVCSTCRSLFSNEGEAGDDVAPRFNFACINTTDLQKSDNDAHCQTWIWYYIYLRYLDGRPEFSTTKSTMEHFKKNSKEVSKLYTEIKYFREFLLGYGMKTGDGILCLYPQTPSYEPSGEAANIKDHLVPFHKKFIESIGKYETALKTFMVEP